MIKTQIKIEWLDKDLSGSSIYRDNDIPIYIEINSDTNPTLTGSNVELVFTHYAEGTKTNITKSTAENGGITIQESSATLLKVITKLTDTELNTLPASVDITFYFKLNCTFPDGNELTLKEGSFISKAL